MTETFENKVDRWAATDYATFATAYDDYVTGCTDGEFAAVVWAKAYKSALSDFKRRSGFVSEYASDVCKDIAGDVTISVAKAAKRADGAYSDAWTWYVSSRAKDAARNARRDACKDVIKSKKAKGTALAAYGENADYSDLYDAIDALSEAERDVIKALYFDGETARSYADKTGSSKSAVSRLSVKACGALATALR
jgi:RNA polymerase sigma factor (sigma-70 family)